MEDVFVQGSAALASFSGNQAMARVLGASKSLRRAALCSMTADIAAAHIREMRREAASAGSDSFDVVIAASVGGFYNLRGIMLCRPGSDVRSYAGDNGDGDWPWWRWFHQYELHIGLQYMFCPRKCRDRQVFLRLPEDGVSLRPLDWERVVHECSNGYWAHGQIRVGSDIPAAVWNFDVQGVGGDKLGFPKWGKAQIVSKQFPYIGFVNDAGPWRMMRDIENMNDFEAWKGMEAGFSFDTHGRYRLKLWRYSEDTLVTELIPEDGHFRPCIRYLRAAHGPYHLVVHIPVCGDWDDGEIPPMFQLISCRTGCSCICASSHAADNAFCADDLDAACSSAWDVSVVRVNALRHIA